MGRSLLPAYISPGGSPADSVSGSCAWRAVTLCIGAAGGWACTKANSASVREERAETEEIPNLVRRGIGGAHAFPFQPLSVAFQRMLLGKSVRRVRQAAYFPRVRWQHVIARLARGMLRLRVEKPRKDLLIQTFEYAIFLRKDVSHGGCAGRGCVPSLSPWSSDYIRLYVEPSAWNGRERRWTEGRWRLGIVGFDALGKTFCAADLRDALDSEEGVYASGSV